MPTSSQLYRKFALGGMEQRFFRTEDGAERIVNLHRHPRGGWESAGGWSPIFPEATQGEDAGDDPFEADSIGPVESMHWFSQHNGGRQWLVWEHVPSAGTSCDLVCMNGSSNDWDTIETGRTYHAGPWQRTRYAANAGWLYFINGEDEPQRWDGQRRVRIGFDRPASRPEVFGPDSGWTDTDQRFMLISRQNAAGTTYTWGTNYDITDGHPQQYGVGTAPPTGSATHPDVATSGWRYGYALAWVNDLGQESPLSPVVWTQGENLGKDTARTTNYDQAGRRSTKVHVPTAPRNAWGWRLYRTKNVDGQGVNSSATVYLLMEEPGRGGCIVIDDVPDDSLGSEHDPDSVGPFPRGAKYLAFFKGTMFLAGAPEYPDRVIYSLAGFPEQYPVSNYHEVGSQDSGEVTGMRATANALVVFKRRGVYLIKGDPVNGFFAETLTEEVGCAAPGALLEAPGQGLVFLSERGPQLLQGALENTGTPTGVVPQFGHEVSAWWEEEVTRSALMRAEGVRYTARRELWFQVPTQGRIRPDGGLVYHYDTGEWSLREGYPMQCLVETADHRAYVYMGSHSAASRGVHTYSTGYDQDGTEVSSSYRSSWMADAWKRSQIFALQPVVKGYGRAVSVSHRQDRRLEFYTADNLASNANDTEDPRDVWGTATWSGSSTWEDDELVVVRSDVYTDQIVLEWQWELSSSKMHLVACAITGDVATAALSPSKYAGSNQETP